MQRVVGVGDGDELHRTHLRTQKAGDVESADGQVGDAFLEHLLDARQHFLAQAHAAAAALRHEGGQCPYQAGAGVGGIDYQAHFGLPTLFHVVGQVFQLAGLFHQLPRAAQ
ncbi:hypothetical protein D9M68_967020 [compost metagenome]